MQLQFQCVRKHLIFDKTYILTCNQKDVTIGETPQRPKYSFQISLSSTIIFHMEEDYYGFSVPYQGKLKMFRAQASKLKELKKLLDARILYGDMSSFYKPIQEIGNGAYSKVSMVQNLRTKQLVAAKFLQKTREGKSQKQRMDDIINEVKILSQLIHPNIIKINEIYESGNSIVIIHEFVDGMTLEEYIQQRGLTLNQNDIQDIIRQILLALIYIHEQGHQHRDLKPDNIMIDKHQIIKLIDFGLATKTGSPFSIQRCGTPGYIAPEILQDQDKKLFSSTKCDMFSLGAIFYKLVTLDDLFVQDQFKTILDKNIESDFSLKILYKTNLSDFGIDLMQKMLQLDSIQRISAKDSLAHPYFKEQQRPSVKKIAQQSTQSTSSNIDFTQCEKISRKYSMKQILMSVPSETQRSITMQQQSLNKLKTTSPNNQ